MAGLIMREDVDAVRERAHIEDVVGAQVMLKRAGIGALKGLCPFHDEKSPSFTVRPAVGRYHCFGCGEGGDVFTFLQKVDGLSFTESVELLAGQVGIQLRYEDPATGGPAGPGAAGRGLGPGHRRRLMDAMAAADLFYQQQLETAGAKAARKFLASRSFSRQDAANFGVGFSPAGWDLLTRHLQAKGFTQAELLEVGLASTSSRGGVIDRFRGRLMWPIRDTTGAVVGFGARRLLDDDSGPKYLNSPETPLYKKSQVLYGIDLAKKDIGRSHQVVVVEGYTDVMAAHLSGVTTAVATCGTAFGPDHAKVITRLLSNDTAGILTFTFDGDQAGQKAAIKAYEAVRDINLQLKAAVIPAGMDPCDLRIAHGPAALRAVVEDAGSLASFVLNAAIAPFDLDTVEGRVGAARAAAPVMGGIANQTLYGALEQEAARRIGVNPADIRREVQALRRTSAGRPGQRGGRGVDSQGFAHSLHEGQVGVPGRRPVTEGSPMADAAVAAVVDVQRLPQPDPRDPVANAEGQALAVILQFPGLVPAWLDGLTDDLFATPAWQLIFRAVRAAGGVAAGAQLGARAWVTAVAGLVQQSAEGGQLMPLLDSLAVMAIPEDREDYIAAYAHGVVQGVYERSLTRQIDNVKARLTRMDPAVDYGLYQQTSNNLLRLVQTKRSLTPATP